MEGGRKIAGFFRVSVNKIRAAVLKSVVVLQSLY